MAEQIRALPISEKTWITQGESFEYDDEKYSKREGVDVVIGIKKQMRGEVYINEEFFKDLLPLVFSKKLTAHVDLYSYPAVVLEKDGRLINHNAEDDYVKELISQAMEETFVANQIRALTDMRCNLHSKEKMSKAAKILRGNLSVELDKKLNYDFMRLYLREKYQLNDITKKSDIANEISLLDKKEMITLQGGILEYSETGKSSFGPLKKLLDKDYRYSDIKEAYNEDLARRFFLGEII